VLPPEAKLCAFDCVYCHYGATDAATAGSTIHYPDVSVIAGELKQALEALGALPEQLDYITFSGNGEPTLHPQFDRIVDEVRILRDRFAPAVPLAILSNSTTVRWPHIRAALMKLDRKIMKLDAGTPATFAAVNRPHSSIRLEEIIEGLSHLERISIQTAFMTGSTDNTSRTDIDAWIEAIRRIRPLDIQVYTIDRPSADDQLRKVDRSILEGIAADVMEKTGITAKVY
jgi:wyosine [tRNA(Phe)-imidazoG37] synthetase (radical SAM superfamily)